MAAPAHKRAQLAALLAQGLCTVHLDARQDGVRVPPALRGMDALPLTLSYRFPAVDLLIDEQHVAATLTFGGLPFRCVLPWSAIWACTARGGVGQAWFEDIPLEHLQRLFEASQAAAEARRPRSARVVN
jgi:stringent starvation protein B